MRHSGKMRYTALGMALGMAVTGGTLVYADDAYKTVSTYLTNDVKIEYNGESKTLPSEYNILNYGDRTYVPLRYISELLGADVEWNNNTRTVIIENDSKTEDTKPEQNNSGHDNTDNGNSADTTAYGTLPQSFESKDFRLSATYLQPEKNEDNPEGRKLYIRLTNESEKNRYQLDVDATTIVIDGEEKTYKSWVSSNDMDYSWYNTYTDYKYENNDQLEGYIRLPKKIKANSKVTVNLQVLQKDKNSDITTIPVSFSFDLSKVDA